jgi:hypothetical protein
MRLALFRRMEIEQNGPHSGPSKGPHRELLTKLFRELFQAERSASRHPRQEADRLRDTRVAEPLRGVASHAERALGEIRELAARHDLPISRWGALVGSSLSLLRTTIVDRLVDQERSYRATLLGLRHGVDLVHLIRRIADASGMVEIGGYCTHWLEEREALVERATAALSWFAEHPDLAAQTPRLVRGRRSGPERPGQPGASRSNA